ncbi:MAG: hypothetical protein L0Y64_26700 [Myxococcaceae bacterium]|nr:hypothetical protein [Myxococcaceae bacterium]
MRAFLPLLVQVVVLSTACGSRAPGPHPDEWLFWRVTTYSLEVGQCSDRQDVADWFAGFFPPLPTDGTAYMPLHVNADGSEVESVTCANLSPSSCQSQNPPLVLSVAGHELFHGTNFQGEVRPSGCAIGIARAWVLVDGGETMESTITYSFGWTGPEAACAEEEAFLQDTSNNGLGLGGCTVVERMAGSLD